MNFPLSHLLCFILPGCTLLFLLTGPHEIFTALAWTLPLIGILLADWLSPTVKPLHHTNMPKWYFDSLLFGLAVLQLTNIFLLLVLVSRLSWDNSDSVLTGLTHLLVIRFLVGTSSCCSGIIVAHEFIHRSKPWQKLLGKILLLSVCYDHFVIAHTQGHHRNVGKPQDISTAKWGESFKDYWRRVAIEQFVYAWKSEKDRMRSEDLIISESLAQDFYSSRRRNRRITDYATVTATEKTDKKTSQDSDITKPSHLSSKVTINFGFRWFHNRVFQGLGIELFLVALIIVFFGWLAAVMFIYQAWVAVRLLEAVNYFQHWGLQDESPDNHPIAWVNNGWFTHQMFLGLPLHICHHKNAAKPFYELTHNDKGPIMPYGFFMMNLWVKINNASFTKMAEQQIEAYIARNN